MLFFLVERLSMSEKTLGYEAAAVDLLDESETSVSGQQVLPSLRKELGRAATTDKIPPRVEVFCWNYADPTRRATFANGTASYLAANPEVKPDSARARAAKLLATDRVRARINEIRAELNRRHELFADLVLNQHMRVLMLDQVSLLDTLRRGELENLPDEVRDLLEIEQVSSKDGVRVLVNFPAKHQSRVEVAKILGMTKDKLELTGADGGAIVTRVERVIVDPDERA